MVYWVKTPYGDMLCGVELLYGAHVLEGRNLYEPKIILVETKKPLRGSSDWSVLWRCLIVWAMLVLPFAVAMGLFNPTSPIPLLGGMAVGCIAVLLGVLWDLKARNLNYP